MSIRVLKLKANNRAHINRVNKKKILGLSYVKKGCCPESISRFQHVLEPCSEIDPNTNKVIKRTVILKKGDVISYRQGTENLKSCIWSAPSGFVAQIKITYFKSESGWDFLNLFNDRNKIPDDDDSGSEAWTHWKNVNLLSRPPPSDSPFTRVLTGNGPFDSTEIITGIAAIQFVSDDNTQANNAGVDFEVIDITPAPKKFIQPIQSLSYHNYLKTAHNFKKNNNKCCDSNGKLVKRIKRLTYKRQPKTDSSLYIENKKNCVLARNPRCAIPTEFICLKDRLIHRGKFACEPGKTTNEIQASQNKKVKTLDFVSAGDYIASKKANRKKANGDKYETDLMDSNQCSIKNNRVLL